MVVLFSFIYSYIHDIDSIMMMHSKRDESGTLVIDIKKITKYEL